jgi:hypothetical protein
LALASDWIQDESDPGRLCNIARVVFDWGSHLGDNVASFQAKLLSKLLSLEPAKAITALYDIAPRCNPLDASSKATLIPALTAICGSDCQSELRLKTCASLLRFPADTDLVKAAVGILAASTDKLSDEVIHLFAASGAAPFLVGTRLYASFATGVVEQSATPCDTLPTINAMEVVRSLHDANHWGLAAALLVRVRGGIATLDIGAAMLARLFAK